MRNVGDLPPLHSIPQEFQAIASICTATEVEIGGRQQIGLRDARDLHAGLNVGRDFSTWIKGRIEEYDLAEGRDYEVSQSPNLGIGEAGHTGGKPTKTYRLTLSVAKELAMVEGNEIGKLVRRYFLWCEDRATRPATPTPPEPSLAERRLRVMERISAIRMVDQIRRTKGPQAAADSLPGIYADVGVRVIASPAPAQQEMDLPPGSGSTG